MLGRGAVKAVALACAAWMVCATGTVFAQAPSAPAVLHDNGAADTGDDSRPQIATDGAGNWVAVWDSFEDLNGTMSFDFDVLVSRSSDNGATWTSPARLNTNGDADTAQDRRPIIATDRDGVWITVWETDGDGGDLDVYFSRSTDNGAAWSPPALLDPDGDDDIGDDEIPYLATDRNGNWVAVWDSNNNIGGSGFELDIVVSRSSDGGLTWSAPALLNSNGTTDGGDDFRAQVESDGDGVWIACWSSNSVIGGGTGDFDIHYARSTDNGATWSPVALLQSNGDTDGGNDLRPGLASDGAGNWVAVWNSGDDLGGTIGNDLDILTVRSTDGGLTWSAPIALNTNAATDTGAD
jgi:Neuraminidase (sialidase)